jgi:hypothetical protein
LILCGLRGAFFQPFCNSLDLLAEHPMDGSAADQVGLRQLSQAVALLAVATDGGAVEDQGFPSDVSAFELGPPHAGAHLQIFYRQLCDATKATAKSSAP